MGEIGAYLVKRGKPHFEPSNICTENDCKIFVESGMLNCKYAFPPFIVLEIENFESDEEKLTSTPLLYLPYRYTFFPEGVYEPLDMVDVDVTCPPRIFREVLRFEWRLEWRFERFDILRAAISYNYADFLLPESVITKRRFQFRCIGSIKIWRTTRCPTESSTSQP
jgi:hypothetical protein